MVRAEVFELRRDISRVLANLLKSLERDPQEATRIIRRRRSVNEPGLFSAADLAEAETLRSELLDLRRDVAVVMANLLIATAKPQEEAKQIVMEALKPRATSEPRLDHQGGEGE